MNSITKYQLKTSGKNLNKYSLKINALYRNDIEELNNRVKITCTRDKDFLTKEEIGNILGLSKKEIKESPRKSLVSSLKIRLCKSSKDYKNNLKKITKDIMIIKFVDYLEKDYLRKDSYLKKIHGMDIDNYQFLDIYMKVFRIEEEYYGKKWYEYNHYLFDDEIDKEYMDIIFNILAEYKIFLGNDYRTDNKDYYYINVNMEMVHSLYEDLNNLGLIEMAHDFPYALSIERYIFNLEHSRCCNRIIDFMNFHKKDKYYEEECRPFYQEKLRLLNKKYFKYLLWRIDLLEKYPRSTEHDERMEILEIIKNILIDNDYLFRFGNNVKNIIDEHNINEKGEYKEYRGKYYYSNSRDYKCEHYDIYNRKSEIHNNSSFEAIINTCRISLCICNYVPDSNGNISFYANLSDIKNSNSIPDYIMDKLKGTTECILTRENKLPEDFDESKTDLHYELIPLDNDLCYLCTEIIYNGESLCKFRWKHTRAN